MAKVFFSYSHDDEQYRDQLEKHLASLRHEGLIESWHDRRIQAGQHLENEIDLQINAADVILLLVSSSFLDSRYCYSIEITRALERNAAGEALIIPVIVRPCDWHSTPLGNLLAAPKDGKAITTWPNYDEAYTDVARQIRAVVTSISPAVTSPAALAVPSAPSFSASIVATPRSSNLALKKTFSELDTDRYLQESFDFISRFFEGSLQELEARNDGISCQFRRIDGNTFTGVIYRQGNKASECSVTLGGMGGRGIEFSSSASARGGFNEMLSVDHDDQSLFLKSLGMAMHVSRSQNLTQEGGAELFWSILIGPLQR